MTHDHIRVAVMLRAGRCTFYSRDVVHEFHITHMEGKLIRSLTTGLAARETCQPVTGCLPVSRTCVRQVTLGRPRTYHLPGPSLEAYRLRT